MKYFLVLLIFAHAVLAEEQIIEDEANTDVDSAGFMMMPMGGCGNTCSCRQRCTIVWWMPCNCGPCNGCGCCNDNDSTTTTVRQPDPEVTTTTTTTTPTTTTTTTEATTTTTTSGCDQSCCSGCSCRRPCTIWWMCPRPCAPSCCNGGCCNSNPTPPPPPPECCKCPVCVPWTPCQPCRCVNNCCPGSNCCSGSGCSTTTTTLAPRNDMNVDNKWLDRIDNEVPEWDIRIPDRTDPWDDFVPRFPRDPISNNDRFRDRRDPVYVPPTSDMIKLEEWEIRDILERRDRRDQRY